MPLARPLVVGRGLSSRNGWTPPALNVLKDAMAERGLRLEDVDVCNPWEARGRMRGRNVVLALGEDAAQACIPAWEGNVLDRRGYVFEGLGGVKVVPSVHPEHAAKVWVPWRLLLSYDIQRIKEQNASPRLERPRRDVEVVTSEAGARRAVEELREAGRVAGDIEIDGAQRVSCVGFAPSPDRAIVFPARFLLEARRVLDSGVRTIWQNGQFDLHFLLTREGIRVAGELDDTLIAWHACYPELAGASQDASGKKKNKTTRKSLAFFGSLFTLDAWWKDYNFSNDMEMYVLNGRDCCITYDVFVNHLEPLIEQLGTHEIYRHEMRLVWPVVEMQARGLRIDNALRLERIEQLEARIDSLDDMLDEIVLPILEERIDAFPEETARLFKQRKRCDCCLNSARKARCWSCAGFSKEPKKDELLAYGAANGWLGTEGLKKAQLLEMLPPCSQCEGAGEFNWLEFNGRSVPQKQALLYDVLKMPKKMKDGTLSTDEDALRGLLAHVS